MDPTSNPTTSMETENQYPEVRIRQNTQAQHPNEEQIERRPPPNWRTNIKINDKLTICRKYYIAGFFLLPLFWLVNFIWHYKDAFQAEPFEEQPQFKRYVLRSGIGFLCWMVMIVCWVIYFQTQRYYYDWDYITFNFPTGSA